MKYIYYPAVLLFLIMAFVEFIPICTYAVNHIWLYQWLLYGMAIYFILRKSSIFSRNEQWLQTTSHEMTHAVVGMMFFHKIHSLQANEGYGEVQHSGKRLGGIFISLSPYCLPIFTFALLFLRIMAANKMLYVFDLLIGFSLAFHIVCFATQTRFNQPDIINQGYVRAGLFIVAAWLFNATIILLSIRKGIIGAITYIFPQYWNDLVHWWNVVIR